jgi:hypothetical protein
VGRVWPRHGHRGRPLNSVVRQHVGSTVAEYSKSQRAELRRLAAEVYEWELRGKLEPLDGSFSEWRRGNLSSSDLSEAIHEYHQYAAREIWFTYQTLKDPDIVARGVALGAISEDVLSVSLREKLEPLLHHFRQWAKRAV